MIQLTHSKDPALKLMTKGQAFYTFYMAFYKVFVEHADQFLHCFGQTVGAPSRLIEIAASRNVRYLRGMAKFKALFGRAV